MTRAATSLATQAGLIGAFTHAAAIGHRLMCPTLYAAFARKISMAAKRSRADHEISDGYERQALIATTA